MIQPMRFYSSITGYDAPMRIKHLVIALALLTLTACATTPHDDPAGLTWKPGTIGPGCSVDAVNDLPAPGERTLRLITQAQSNDPKFDNAIAQTLIVRRDGKPIATLGDITKPGAALRFNIYRDASTGGGFPDYSLPYLFLLVQHADGSTSRLLWESPYNGFSMSKKNSVPTNQWLTIDVAPGTYWPQTDATNFNMYDGFQKLPKYAGGFRSTRKDGKVSPPYSNDSAIIAIGIGSGANLGGHLLAYLGEVVLVIPGEKPTTIVFKP